MAPFGILRRAESASGNNSAGEATSTATSAAPTSSTSSNATPSSTASPFFSTASPSSSTTSPSSPLTPTTVASPSAVASTPISNSLPAPTASPLPLTDSTPLPPSSAPPPPPGVASPDPAPSHASQPNGNAQPAPAARPNVGNPDAPAPASNTVSNVGNNGPNAPAVPNNSSPEASATPTQVPSSDSVSDSSVSGSGVALNASPTDPPRQEENISQTSITLVSSSRTIVHGVTTAVPFTTVVAGTVNPALPTATQSTPNTSLTNSDSGVASGSAVHTGAIVGGVVGGITALFLLVALVFFVRRRRNLRLEKAALRMSVVEPTPRSSGVSHAPSFIQWIRRSRGGSVYDPEAGLVAEKPASADPFRDDMVAVDLKGGVGGNPFMDPPPSLAHPAPAYRH